MQNPSELTSSTWEFQNEEIDLCSCNVCTEDANIELFERGEPLMAELKAAGPEGLAAAAAIASMQSSEGNHNFERDPRIRHRLRTRLLQKLQRAVKECATKLGQQVAVVVASPGTDGFKVYGAEPLVKIITGMKDTILEELSTSLMVLASGSRLEEDSDGCRLPRLTVDGIPTCVKNMTQNQLRSFIPNMIKWSTGRSAPGWGRTSTKPPWWPVGVPWANVRKDVRDGAARNERSWSDVLRQIVTNCYYYHGKEECLHLFQNKTPEAVDIDEVAANEVVVGNYEVESTATVYHDTSANAVYLIPIVHVPQDGPAKDEAVKCFAVAQDDVATHSLMVHVNADARTSSWNLIEGNDI